MRTAIAGAAWAVVVLGVLPLACRSSTGAPAPGASAAGCTNTECKAPACCGDACTQGSCCTGAICSVQGRCIPDTCQVCGGAGCNVDFATCSATCAKPSCCLDACASDGDCCAGAHCGADGRCTPDLCKTCSGMTSECSVDDSCTAKCVAPASCGRTCAADAECGTGSVCQQLDIGSYCVPQAFSAECAKCGSAGCTLRPDCSVRCGYVDPDAGAGDAGACSRCCEPCTTDHDCCSGALCDAESSRCVPAGCAECPYGCTFNCPYVP